MSERMPARQAVPGGPSTIEWGHWNCPLVRGGSLRAVPAPSSAGNSVHHVIVNAFSGVPRGARCIEIEAGPWPKSQAPSGYPGTFGPRGLVSGAIRAKTEAGAQAWAPASA